MTGALTVSNLASFARGDTQCFSKGVHTHSHWCQELLAQNFTGMYRAHAISNQRFQLPLVQFQSIGKQMRH